MMSGSLWSAISALKLGNVTKLPLMLGKFSDHQVWHAKEPLDKGYKRTRTGIITAEA